MFESEPGSIPTIPKELPILPIRGAVVFPVAVVPIAVGQPSSMQLVEEVMRGDRLIGIVTQKKDDTPATGPEDLYEVGTSGIIRQLHRSDDGLIQLIVQGLGRIRLRGYTQTQPYLVARVEELNDEELAEGAELTALTRTAKDLFGRLAQATPELPDEIALAMLAFDEPLQVTYLLSTTLPIPLEVRQELLEIDSVAARLKRLIELTQQELSVRELEQKIADDTKVRISDTQREYVLRERLRSIQEELGEAGGETGDLRKRLAELKLPEEARREAERELDRLDRIPDISPEHGMIRSYLEWLLAVPWGISSGKPIDLVAARKILDRDHYDLDKIKERLIEHLAVKKLLDERAAEAAPADQDGSGTEEDGKSAESGRAGDPRPGASAESGTAGLRREPILCFVGPPGTGKTSLGQSIARALGRKFARASLGGIQDEAEIRGHRRTYIGSMPGRIIQALRRVEVSDPVFMLDEIDKLGTGFHGDPSAALLEVLDPSQNHAFVDTYLGVPVDLSQVLFICTANTTDPIPPPLLDRMEVVRLAGYTDEEKTEIALRHLLPNQLASHGLRDDEVILPRATIAQIIRKYTKEAGVRNLEREIASILRKVARRVGEGEKTPIEIAPDKLSTYLGPRRHYDEVAERIDRPGVATGLAWTPTGGDIIFIEAAMMEGGKKELMLTGMLGDVMRESAQAALTWLRSNAGRLGIDPARFQGKSFHVHVPAGAIPKDGPSAGVAIIAALASLISGRCVRADVAMTGEITLRGKVLPVGGIRDKVLGAHRAGIREVLLPRHSKGSLEEVTDEVREEMDFVFLDSVDEVIDAALEPKVVDTALEPRIIEEPAHPPM